MEKGHIDVKELLVAAVLVITLCASVLLLTASKEKIKTLEPQINQTKQPIIIQHENKTIVAEQAIPQIPSFNISNETMGELLEDGLERADSRFYSSFENGTVHIETARWYMGQLNESPDAIPIKPNDIRASEIRFDGRYIDSLRGFAFNLYELENMTAPPGIYGTAVFYSESTPLDEKTGAIVVDYDPHPRLSQILEGCTILSSEIFTTPQGGAFKVYDFRCKLMYGAWI